MALLTASWGALEHELATAVHSQMAAYWNWWRQGTAISHHAPETLVSPACGRVAINLLCLGAQCNLFNGPTNAFQALGSQHVHAYASTSSLSAVWATIGQLCNPAWLQFMLETLYLGFMQDMRQVCLY